MIGAAKATRSECPPIADHDVTIGWSTRVVAKLRYDSAYVNVSVHSSVTHLPAASRAPDFSIFYIGTPTTAATDSHSTGRRHQ